MDLVWTQLDTVGSRVLLDARGALGAGDRSAVLTSLVSGRCVCRAEAGPGGRVFLFGSHARGEAMPDSDLDFLVIEPEVDGRHAEMVRLRGALRGLEVPVDVIVYSDAQVERFGRTWGHVACATRLKRAVWLPPPDDDIAGALVTRAEEDIALVRSSLGVPEITDVKVRVCRHFRHSPENAFWLVSGRCVCRMFAAPRRYRP